MYFQWSLLSGCTCRHVTMVVNCHDEGLKASGLKNLLQTVKKKLMMVPYPPGTLPPAIWSGPQTTKPITNHCLNNVSSKP